MVMVSYWVLLGSIDRLCVELTHYLVCFDAIRLEVLSYINMSNSLHSSGLDSTLLESDVNCNDEYGNWLDVIYSSLGM